MISREVKVWEKGGSCDWRPSLSGGKVLLTGGVCKGVGFSINH